MSTSKDYAETQPEWERNQCSRAEYAHEMYRIRERNAWLERNKYKVVTVLMVLGFTLSWVFAPNPEDQVIPAPVAECPDGIEWTTWCGCEPPILGDDC